MAAQHDKPGTDTMVIGDPRHFDALLFHPVLRKHMPRLSANAAGWFAAFSGAFKQRFGLPWEIGASARAGTDAADGAAGHHRDCEREVL